MFDLTLTFDNGPDPDVTPDVLAALRERGIASTFFVIGEKLAEHRDLVEATRAEGHWIGNHTWTHRVPLGDRPAGGGALEEIRDTQAELGELAHADRLFRPFSGGAISPRLLNAEAVRYLQDNGFTCVLWNAVPEEWLDPEGWVERALEQCRERPWSLMVLHDLPTGAMAHLPRFLDAVTAMNGNFRQDFPPECLPIRLGRPCLPLSPYLASGAAGQS